MKVYDNEIIADEGKQFILTQKGKDEVASWNYKEVGEVMDKFEPAWAWNSGYIEEVDIPGWTTIHGYRVGNYNKNKIWISAGNPQNFYTLKAAEDYKANYEKYPWLDRELIVDPINFMGVPLKPITNFYKGKEVIDWDHYFGLMAHNIGDYFNDEVVEWFRDCVPPTWNSSTMVQCGEPTNHKKHGATYATFVKIADGVWEFKGDCYKGKDVN